MGLTASHQCIGFNALHLVGVGRASDGFPDLGISKTAKPTDLDGLCGAGSGRTCGFGRT